MAFCLSVEDARITAEGRPTDRKRSKSQGRPVGDSGVTSCPGASSRVSKEKSTAPKAEQAIDEGLSTNRSWPRI